MTHPSVSVPPLMAEQVVDLINEFADMSRLAAGETDDPYPNLEWLGAPGSETHDLVAVANALYPAFSDPSNAVRILNHLADDVEIKHRLDDDARLGWVLLTESNQALAMATACLIDFIADFGTSPLGTCSATQCADVYIDRSQAQERAYCSERCNNRVRVARWRARQRDQA